MSVLLFAFAFVGSAVGSAAVRDVEETAESETDADDAIVGARRARASASRRPRFRPVLAVATARTGAGMGTRVPPAVPGVGARSGSTHTGVPRRVPPDAADDDADAAA